MSWIHNYIRRYLECGKLFVDIKFRDGHCRICMHHIIYAKVTNLLIPHRRRKQKKGNREAIKRKGKCTCKGRSNSYASLSNSIGEVSYMDLSSN